VLLTTRLSHQKSKKSKKFKSPWLATPYYGLLMTMTFRGRQIDNQSRLPPYVGLPAKNTIDDAALATGGGNAHRNSSLFCTAA
jgi:hypothetical protein